MLIHSRFLTTGALLLGLLIALPGVAQDGAEAALAQDLQQKGDACLAVSPMTKDARACAISCGRMAAAVAGSSNMAAEQLERYRQLCGQAYVSAGFALRGPPVPIAAPTLDERIAAMPDKSAYCAAQKTALDCSMNLPTRNDFADPNGPCASASFCANYCGQNQNMSARLTGRDSKGARKTLANCEQAYDRLRRLVGEADQASDTDTG